MVYEVWTLINECFSFSLTDEFGFGNNNFYEVTLSSAQVLTLTHDSSSKKLAHFN